MQLKIGLIVLSLLFLSYGISIFFSLTKLDVNNDEEIKNISSVILISLIVASVLLGLTVIGVGAIMGVPQLAAMRQTITSNYIAISFFVLLLVVMIIFTALLNKAVKEDSFKVSGYENILAAKKDYLVRVSLLFILIGCVSLFVAFKI